MNSRDDRQDIGFPVLFMKERCSYSYTLLKKKCWGIKDHARVREIYEIFGLDAMRFYHCDPMVAPGLSGL